MCEKRIVNHRGLVAIAPNRVAGSRGRIGDNENFKSLLEQVAQMGFYAHIGEHATEHDLAHVAFAQLEYEIVCLRAKDLVRTDYDGFAIVDERLERFRHRP